MRMQTIITVYVLVYVFLLSLFVYYMIRVQDALLWNYERRWPPSTDYSRSGGGWLITYQPWGGSNEGRNQAQQQRCLVGDAGFARALTVQREAVQLLRKFTDLNDDLASHFNAIWLEMRERLRLLLLFMNSGAVKYFVEFNDAYNTESSSCSIVTLGVGQATRAERHLSHFYPQCRFLGADPVATGNAPLYEAISESGTARFVQMAVGGEGNHTDDASGASRPTPAQQKQQQQSQRQRMGLVEFFERFHPRNESAAVVDLLLVDMDGAEYEILRQLARNLNALPPVCQINVAFHIPEAAAAKTEGVDGELPVKDSFLSDFQTLLDGHYFLLNTDYATNDGDGTDGRGAVLRLFMVNFAHGECVKKFLCY